MVSVLQAWPKTSTASVVNQEAILDIIQSKAPINYEKTSRKFCLLVWRRLVRRLETIIYIYTRCAASAVAITDSIVY
jgi:hypothetical protein